MKYIVILSGEAHFDTQKQADRFAKACGIGVGLTAKALEVSGGGIAIYVEEPAKAPAVAPPIPGALN